MLKLNKRRRYFIDKEFQIRFILRFCTIVILASIAIGVMLFFFSRSSMTVGVNDARIAVKCTAVFLLPIIIQTLLLVTFFSAISVIMLTLFVSHRIVGPLYRLTKEIERLGQGDLNSSCRIRSNDQLQELANALCKTVECIKERIIYLRRGFSDLRSCCENLPTAQKQVLGDKLNKIEEALNYFKI